MTDLTLPSPPLAEREEGAAHPGHPVHSGDALALLSQENCKIKGHLDRVIQIARKRGFDGSSGVQMIAFLDDRLRQAQEADRQLAAIHDAIQRLEKGAPLQSVARVIDEAATRINALRATVEVLVAPRVSPGLSPAMPGVTP